MGDVVSLFGKPDQPPREADQRADTKRQENKRGLTTAEVMSAMLEYVAPIRMHLSVLQGHVSDGNIRERKDGLRNYSNDDLLQMAQSSTELDWNQRPAFYWALVEELEERIVPAPLL